MNQLKILKVFLPSPKKIKLLIYMVKITGIINKSENPKWPPILNSYIAIQKTPIDKIFIGKVINNVLNSTGFIVKLINTVDYVDEKLPDNNHLLLIPSYSWKYLSERKLKTIYNYLKLTNKETKNDCVNDIDYTETSLLDKSGKIDVTNMFKDNQINSQLFSKTEKFTPTSKEIQNLLQAKLKTFQDIKNTDIKLVVNKSVALENLIDTKEDEINEGTKIINWISQNMINTKTETVEIFNDLKMAIFNGYVHIARKGINTNDIITRELVGNLKYFSWQFNIPIDYDSLKFVLFNNEKVSTDIEQQKEADKILSQEYLICLQPEPIYQLWCVKRLIMCWYGDEELQYNIRKIKVLINHWRSRNDQEYNRKNGILPSIVIYPRYGKKSARLVLQKISDYFLLYQNIGWKCSAPHYISKINNLMGYTNGSIDLKMYFKYVTK